MSPRVSRRAEHIARQTIGHLQAISPARHTVRVRVSAAHAVTSETGAANEVGVSFGVFTIQTREIRLAAGMVRHLMREHKLTRTEAESAFMEVVCHEWAHYEQFRDGRPVVERGVGARARVLYDRVAEQVQHRT